MGDCLSKQEKSQSVDRHGTATLQNVRVNTAESEDSGIELPSTDNNSTNFNLSYDQSSAAQKTSNNNNNNFCYKEIGSSSGGK